MASLGARPATTSKWELVKLAVHPSFRGKGLAKKLLKYVIHYCIDEMKRLKTSKLACDSDEDDDDDNDSNTGKIYLDTSSKLIEAIKLYSKFGFQIIENSPELGVLYDTADVYMERSVDLYADESPNCIYGNNTNGDCLNHLIICDVGEDFDDELALYWAATSPKSLSVSTYVLFVGGHVRGCPLKDDELSNWRRSKWNQHASNLQVPVHALKLFSISEFEQLLDSIEDNPQFDVTLICAPLHVTDSLYAKLSKIKTRVCCLSGSASEGALNYGSTSNARNAVQLLLKTASISYVFPTHELQKSTYTAAIMKKLPSYLCDRIKTNAYKFVVGRAGSQRGHVAARDVAHLLSPTLAQKMDGKRAINFSSIGAIYQSITSHAMHEIPISSVSDKALTTAKEYSGALCDFDEWCNEIGIDKTIVINEFAIAFHALFEMELCETCMYSEDECFDDEYLLNSNSNRNNEDAIPHGFRVISQIVSEKGSPFPCYDLTALRLMYRILGVDYD